MVPLCETMTEAIADAIYSEIILRFGNFQTLCSDNAANMSTLAVKEICHLLSIKTRKLMAYQLSSNGKIERTMAVIGAGFRKFGQDTKDWLHLLKVIASSINSSPQAHTQFSPFFLQHFREYPSIFAFSDSTEGDPTNDGHYYSNVVKRVMEDKRISIDIYQQIHDDYCKTQEDSKNKGRKVIPLAINQPVYLKIFHPSTDKSAKLQPRWKGTFLHRKLQRQQWCLSLQRNRSATFSYSFPQRFRKTIHHTLGPTSNNPYSSADTYQSQRLVSTRLRPYRILF